MRNDRRSWWRGIVLSVFLASSGGIARSADEIDDSRILESSGLVASQRVEKRFWTHNDSGHAARLFAIDGPERRVTAVDVIDAELVDWEDIAAGVVDGRPMLIIGDVGDNARRRDHVTLYVVDEPEVETDRSTTGDRQDAATVRRRIDVRYPDGPKDCEAIAIDAERRRVILIAKQALPTAGVYAVPIPAEEKEAAGEAAERGEAGRVVVAERIGTLPLPMVTGMDIRSDGLRMAVVGYFDLFLFDREAKEDWPAALRRVPVHVALPKLKQTEAVCFDRHGDIWITSEGSPMPMVRVSTSPKGHDDRNRDEVPGR